MINIYISYTRLYVDATKSLLRQSRKKSLLSLINQWWERMGGLNLFFIIIISKYRKKAFKIQKTIIQRGRKLDLKGIYQNSVLSLEFTPPPLLRGVIYIISPPIPIYFLVPLPLSNPPPPCWDWAHGDDGRHSHCRPLPPILHICRQGRQRLREQLNGDICIP